MDGYTLRCCRPLSLSCHCRSSRVTSLIHVDSAIASVQTVTLIVTFNSLVNVRCRRHADCRYNKLMHRQKSENVYTEVREGSPGVKI